MNDSSNATPSDPPAEDRFSALLDAAVDAIVLIDCQGRITRFSRAAERLFGYRADEVLGCNISLLMPAPDRDHHDAYLDRYLETQQKHIIGIGREVLAQRRDGSAFPIDLSVGEFHSGSERGFVGIIRDITQRKQQEAELRARNDELRLIFDNAPTGITITAADGIIISANRACGELLDYPLAELVGRSHIDLVIDEDRARVAADLARVADSGETVGREVRYRRRDGQPLYALLHSGAVRNQAGTTELMICAIVDRGALYEATREAEQLRAKLTHVSRLGTLGEMVSGIAHEVNQPLTAIANYAYGGRRLLQAGKAAEGELATVLDKIGTQAERAGQVIRGLRKLGRHRDATRERLDCNALLQEVARLIEFELRASGWKLQMSLAPQLPAVRGDGVQIQQVILNLLRNAFEAMNEAASGDTIWLSSASPIDAYVDLSVADCGAGLSDEGEERLYEPFFTTKPQGMGLGLSISKSIAAAHGGELLYQRAHGGGAEFTLRLPTVTD